jgi:hypothetical protein
MPALILLGLIAAVFYVIGTGCRRPIDEAGVTGTAQGVDEGWVDFNQYPIAKDRIFVIVCLAIKLPK